eukprot:gb/GECG01010001.1/.p1 GENE.gb/GECG01010001.1/~~gb/GECG01010001.1/.p1  ORF type:complete len:108 (+),score=7.25 gb/GECG01010001.1/:1-324(+)
MSGAASPSAQPLSASSGTRGGEQGASHRQSSVSGHYHATTHTSTTEQGQGTSTFRDETTDVQQESQLRSLQDDIDRKQVCASIAVILLFTTNSGLTRAKFYPKCMLH